MGTVHQLPLTADAHARQLQKLVDDIISRHPDPCIAKRWAAMANETIGRYPGPPMPSKPELDLDAVEGLDSAHKQQVQQIVERWLMTYFEDVRTQLMKVHFDLLSLQKSVAEFEAERE